MQLLSIYKHRVSVRAIAALALFALTVLYLAYSGWLTGLSRAAYYGYYELRFSGKTEYAPSFHPIEWDLVRIGATMDKVYSQFGAPIWVAGTTGELVWTYDSPKRQVTFQRNYRGAMSRDSTEFRVTKSDIESQNLVGLTEEQIVQQLGKPDRVEQTSTNQLLQYSSSRIENSGGGHFVQYVVEVDVQEKVVGKHVYEVWH